MTLGDLLHTAHTEDRNPEVDDQANIERATRTGLVLFALYFTVYAVYVLLNALWPASMSLSVGGVTLAVWYGLGLIALAQILALVYCWLCHVPLYAKPTDQPVASAMQEDQP